MFCSKAGVTASKTQEVGPLGAAEKKVRMLEQQRAEVEWLEGVLGAREDPSLPRACSTKVLPGPWL